MELIQADIPQIEGPLARLREKNTQWVVFEQHQKAGFPTGCLSSACKLAETRAVGQRQFGVSLL